MNNGNIISSDKVEGSNVYNASGDKLGAIDDLMIDRYTGTVRYAVMEFGGFLGMGTDRYPLPWSILKYDTQLDGYVVPVDKSVLENAPRYSRNEIPEYSDAYGQQVYGHYGVNWI